MTGWGGNPDDAMDEEGVLGVAEEKDIANPDRPVEEGVDFEEIAILNEGAH